MVIGNIPVWRNSNLLGLIGLTNTLYFFKSNSRPNRGIFVIM